MNFNSFINKMKFAEFKVLNYVTRYNRHIYGKKLLNQQKCFVYWPTRAACLPCT